MGPWCPCLLSSTVNVISAMVTWMKSREVTSQVILLKKEKAQFNCLSKGQSVKVFKRY